MAFTDKFTFSITKRADYENNYDSDRERDKNHPNHQNNNNKIRIV